MEVAKKKGLLAVAFVLILCSAAAAVLGLTPYGGRLASSLRSAGYVAYTPEAAKQLAMERCVQCHNLDKTIKYCSRCGPPLIVVVHNMKQYEASWRKQNPTAPFNPITDAESVAIVQVWNALVGDWENTWAVADMEKMLAGNAALLKLFRTPLKDRPIEMALRGTSAPGSYREGEGTVKPGEMPAELLNKP